MSKREHGNMNGSGENDRTRHKRRRDVGGSSSDVDISASDPIVEESKVGGLEDVEKVKEDGLRLWQIVKDAVNKEGRSLSFDFIRKPSKRLYPDYYELIKHPIALDDIKKQLDTGGYSSLEAVKNDFELCFSNAKQYNQTESIIFQDAKELLRLVHKTYSKLVPSEEDMENGKSKTPNLNRLIKARLEKLVGKTDSTGRVLSDEFMQLPSKKTWPFYYKEIKKPQCFENIFKRIKRKEYQSSNDFAADVELVFSNALTFNQDETPIWHDAMALRDYFRQLMSDLPPPHSLLEYVRPSNKIKIRPPQAAQLTASNSTTQTPKLEATAPSSLFLRVPAQNAKPAAQATAPAAPIASPALPSTAPVPKKAPAPKVSTAQVQPQAPTPKLPAQTVSFINATPSHYPNASYFPQAAAATTSTTSATPPILRASSIMNTHTQSASQSPAPVTLPPSHQLRSVSLRIEPRGRTFDLDHKTGVKSWAVRLMSGETSILLSNVSFLGDEEDESSGDEEADIEKHEEEEDVDMDVDVEADAPLPVKNGRRKGKGRGKGKPAKVSTVTTRQAAAKTMKQPKKTPLKIGEVQVKLNGSLMKEQPEQAGQWSISVSVGSSVVEVGEVGGMVWKVYVERIGPV